MIFDFSFFTFREAFAYDFPHCSTYKHFDCQHFTIKSLSNTCQSLMKSGIMRAQGKPSFTHTHTYTPLHERHREIFIYIRMTSGIVPHPAPPSLGVGLSIGNYILGFHRGIVPPLPPADLANRGCHLFRKKFFMVVGFTLPHPQGGGWPKQFGKISDVRLAPISTHPFNVIV